MFVSKVITSEKISRIIYEDNSYYYGQENKANQIRNGYGKFCKEDGTIIEAGYWLDDECIESMSEERIEGILKDLY